jgi:hypothetical protein
MTTTTEKTKMNVTTEELTYILMTVEKGTFGYLHMETKVKMNKTGNPYFDRVTKITKGNILLGGSYQTRVQNETHNPDFVPEENKVGEHVSKCVLYNENTGKNYLQYEWFKEVLPKSEYQFNGDIIEKKLFESYMSKYTPNKYGVNLQSVTINNIKECHINRMEYIVVNP